MSLLGTFAPADEGDGAVTSGSRTTTSGSLVVAAGAGWTSSTQTPDLALTSNQAGTYTEAFENELAAVGDTAVIALTYNSGGTRAAGHTLTNTMTDGINVSVSGAEFDGVDASPTVTTGSVATGTSTAPSCTVTVPSGTATVVALVTYKGTSTTIAMNSGTQATEADENSDNQAHNLAYKLTQSGAVTISWTLGASREWACRAVAFSEPAGGSTPTPAQGVHVVTGRGTSLGFAINMPAEP